MAVPANVYLTATFQDNRGYKAQTRIPLFFTDISSTVAGGDVAVISLFNLMAAPTTSIMATLAAMSNAKLVKVSFSFDFDYAQEPSTETGEYQLVIQKAKLRLGDGNGGVSQIDIPAPVDALFLDSGTDNMIVVDPAATVLTNFQAAFNTAYSQAAIAALSPKLGNTPRGGVYASLFNGGQLVQGKPRRRRVVQGA